MANGRVSPALDTESWSLVPNSELLLLGMARGPVVIMYISDCNNSHENAFFIDIHLSPYTASLTDIIGRDACQARMLVETRNKNR